MRQSHPVSRVTRFKSSERLPRLGSLLFFLMLVVPTTYQPFKLLLLLPCLVGAILSERFRPSPKETTILLAVAALGAFEVGYGLFRGTPGAATQWTVFILWPVVFFILSSTIDTVGRLRSLFRTMVAASWTIGLYGTSLVLVETGRIPAWVYFGGIDAGQGTYLEQGAVAFNLYALSSVVFLLPSLLALAITWTRGTPPPVPWWCLLGAICILLLLVLMSGRRALFVNLIVFPSMLAVFALLTRATGGRRAIFAGLALIPIAFGGARLLGLDLSRVMEYLVSGEIKAQSSAIRVAQLHQLLDAWRADNIFFGSGLGAVAPGPVRSFETPWAYELAYVALLFQIGIVGLLLYSVVVFTTYAKLVSVAKGVEMIRPWAAFVFMGGLSFLLATASNPYLLKFDYIWILFLPVVVARIAANLSPDDADPNRERNPAMNQRQNSRVDF